MFDPIDRVLWYTPNSVNPRLFSTEDSRWVSNREGTRRNVPGYDTAGGDNSPVSDCHPRQNDDSIAEPHLIADANWLSIRTLCSLLWTVIVVVDNGAVCANEAIGTNLHESGRGDVSAIVDRGPITDFEPTSI